MELKDIIGKALEISKEQKFLVRIYENKDLYVENELDYFTLGTYLATNINTIKRIDIKL